MFFCVTESSNSQTITFSASIGEGVEPCTASCTVENLSTGQGVNLGSSALGTLNSFTAEGLPPGVYRADCGVSWIRYDWYNCIDGVGLSSNYGWLSISNPLPTSVDKTSKTVHYTCTVEANRVWGYDEVLHQPLTSLNYASFAPDGNQTTGGGITVPNADSFTADVTIAYSIATHNDGYYMLVFDGESPSAFEARSPTDLFTYWYCEWDPANLPPWGVTYGQSHVRNFSDYPTFRINGVHTSTTNPGSWPQLAIEPAYGDSVTYYWERRYNEFHAKSIALFQEFDQPGGDGTYYPSQNSAYQDKFYKEIPNSEAFLDDERNTANFSDFDLSAQPQKLTATGELTWPGKDANDNLKYYPEFPSGRHKVGIKYDDGHVELVWSFVDVNLSVYDAYTDSKAPFFVADDSEGKTSIYYKMSAPAQEGGVDISIGGVKTIEGTPNKGQNVLPDAWDGTTTSQEYVNGGSYGLTFNVTPLVGQVGSLLYLGASHTYGFTPAPPSNESLTITYSITESVRRPQATEAKVTAVIYDSNGMFVRLLANEQIANIGGNNELVWDGKDEQGEIVDEGDYKISLFAKDNAGVGCESNSSITTVKVQDPPQSEVYLEWPAGDYSLDEENDPDIIAGYTDSDSYSVDYSIDSGQTQTASVDYSTGMFSIDVSGLTGQHTVTIHTNDSRYGERTISVSFFRNNFSPTTPQNGARFDPPTNGDITFQYSSEAADTVDVYVVNPYDQSACISQQQPVPVAEVLNGTVSEKTVRTIATGHAVIAGSNNITWDGKDGNGSFVPPGIYNVVVRRSNADELLDLETVTQVVVEHPTGAPQISAVTATSEGSSITINWSTDVPTTGYVVCEPDSDMQPIFRIPSMNASTSHTVWLPGTTSGTTYSYYVIAINSTTGATAVSDLRNVMAGNGPITGNASLTLSGTELQISYSAESLVTAAIEYAQVGPGISPIQWQRVEHAFKDQDHLFTLTDLQPNAEYVYRILSATDDSWTNSTKSEFRWFTTKTALSSISFTNLEDRGGVTALSDITVRASDATHRFSAHGITNVELYIDGELVESNDKVAAENYVDYTFHAGTMNLANGLHQIEAVAYDDYWHETTSHIQVLLDSGGGMQSMSASSAVVVQSQSSSTSGLSKEWRKAQCVARVFRLGYRAGPRYNGKRKNGSIGYLYLRMSSPSGWKLLGCWRATSGIGWNYRVTNNTMPPGQWRTGPHSRVGDKVEGESKPDFGAYLIHVDQVPYRCRIPGAFHIHGNWGPASKSPYYGTIDGERYYHNSHGCIILHRNDLLDLKAKWKTYVLRGAEHGPSSVGIPLKVQYFDKQVTP